MKLNRTLALLLVGFALGFIFFSLATNLSATVSPVRQEATERKMPDVITLATESKLGPVTFNHTNHTTKNYNVAGTGPIDCVKCHHTAQPESEVTKHPPLKTAWPKDRTDTLTAETFKDPKSPAVVACRDCHARADTKPKVLPEIPQVKYEGAEAPIKITNQQAFHRKCAGCHDEAMKARTDIKAPKTTQCLLCHKKAAGTATGD